MHGPTHMSAHSQTQDKVKCTFSRVLIKLRDCTLQQSTYRCLVRKDTHIVDSISSQMSSNCCWCQKIIQTIWHISTAECQLEKTCDSAFYRSVATRDNLPYASH